MPILGIIASGISGNLSVPGQNWTNGYELPTAESYFSGGYIRFGNGVYITFTQTGVQTSSDLTNWTTYAYTSMPFISNQSQTNNLVFDGTNFVLLGYDASIAPSGGYRWYTSSNGQTWTAQNAINLSGQTGGYVSPYYLGIAYSNGRYLINGGNSTGTGLWYTTNIATTPTFVQVRESGNNISFGYGFNAAGSWLIAGSNGNWYAYSSNTGNTWSYANVQSSGFTMEAVGPAISSSGTAFLPLITGVGVATTAGGSITRYLNPSYWFMAATDGGSNIMMCAWYQNTYAWSSNGGSSWTQATFTESVGNARINFANGNFFVYVSSTTQRVIRIPTSNYNSPTYLNLGSTLRAANSPSFILSSGTQGAVMTTTGTDLIRLAQGGLTGTRTTGVFTNGAVSSCSYLTVGGTPYLVAGATNEGYYYSSDNGVNWTFVNGSSNPGNYIGQMVTNGSVIVTMQQNGNYLRYSNSPSISSVTQSGFVNSNGNSMSVPAVTSTGQIWMYDTSNSVGFTRGYYCTTNAAQAGWTAFTNLPEHQPNTGGWYRPFGLNGRNILVGNSGTRLSYSQGDIQSSTWTNVTVPVTTGYSMIFANGRYMLAARDTSPAMILYSTDLNTWTAAATVPSNYWTNNGTSWPQTGAYNTLTYDGVAFLGIASQPTNIFRSV